MEEEKGLLLRPWSVTTTVGCCWVGGSAGVSVGVVSWLLLVTSARVDLLWKSEERVILLFKPNTL